GELTGAGPIECRRAATDIVDGVAALPPALTGDGTSDPCGGECDGKEVAEENLEEEEEVEEGCCAICTRDMPLTRHHLIPRAVHKKMAKKGYSKECLQTCVLICRPCHSAVHRLIPQHMVLATEYASLQRLLEHDGVKRWASFAAKQKTYSKDHALKGLKYSR